MWVLIDAETVLADASQPVHRKTGRQEAHDGIGGIRIIADRTWTSPAETLRRGALRRENPPTCVLCVLPPRLCDSAGEEQPLIRHARNSLRLRTASGPTTFPTVYCTVSRYVELSVKGPRRCENVPVNCSV